MPAAKKAIGNRIKKKPKDQPSTAAATAARPGPARPGRAPASAATGPSEPHVSAARRIAEIEAQQRELEREKKELLPRVAAIQPPILRVGDFEGRKKGFSYHTWFKGFGVLDRRNYREDISGLLEEIEEFEDGSLPAAFISHGILGRVKWQGIRDREEIIQELNDMADWAPLDFRDIYDRWEYTYRIVESVGDVPIGHYEYRASKPRRNGYAGR